MAFAAFNTIMYHVEIEKQWYCFFIDHHKPLNILFVRLYFLLFVTAAFLLGIESIVPNKKKTETLTKTENNNDILFALARNCIALSLSSMLSMCACFDMHTFYAILCILSMYA